MDISVLFIFKFKVNPVRSWETIYGLPFRCVINRPTTRYYEPTLKFKLDEALAFVLEVPDGFEIPSGLLRILFYETSEHEKRC